MTKTSAHDAILLAAMIALGSAAAAGCGDDDPGGDGDGGAASQLYAVSSIVTTPDTQTGYVSILRSLTPSQEETDLRNAYEFAGAADMWVQDGPVFVSSGESPTVTKFSVADDGRLVEEATISFADYGITSTAFWHNTFVSETKAYMINGVAEYVIWNPVTMEITGTLELPEMEPREGLIPRAASADRANIMYRGRLYQPLYWSDEAYADRADDSQIAVFDVENDELIDVLDAPCPGLDIGTADESGNLYFSNWTGGVGTRLVLGTAANCVVAVNADTLAVSVAFHFEDVAEGREGAVFHYIGNDQFVFSVFHEERVDVAGATDPYEILGGLDWMLWTYDRESGAAAPMDTDWNSGAVYWFQVDGKAHALVPGTNYASSTVFEVDGEENTATTLFDFEGYGIRLFRVR